MPKILSATAEIERAEQDLATFTQLVTNRTFRGVGLKPYRFSTSVVPSLYKDSDHDTDGPASEFAIQQRLIATSPATLDQAKKAGMLQGLVLAVERSVISVDTANTQYRFNAGENPDNSNAFDIAVALPYVLHEASSAPKRRRAAAIGGWISMVSYALQWGESFESIRARRENTTQYVLRATGLYTTADTYDQVGDTLAGARVPVAPVSPDTWSPLGDLSVAAVIGVDGDFGVFSEGRKLPVFSGSKANRD